MIITQLTGSLGDQMFQYALGRRLAIERKQPLFLDLSWYTKHPEMRFGLDQFNIQAEIADPDLVYKTQYFSRNKYFRKAYTLFQDFLPIEKRRVIREDPLVIFGDQVFQSPRPIYLMGKWQSELYFSSIMNQLRTDFTPKEGFSSEDNELIKKICSNSNSVGVQLIRGDLIENYHEMSTRYICTPDYYLEALTLLRKKIPKDLTLYIFADDPTWWVSELCQYLEDSEFFSLENLSEAKFLFLFSKCRHQIISNTSLGWWGAWLNDNPQKLIISPSTWRHNQYTPDLIPPDWIKLKHDDKNDWKYVDIPFAEKAYQAKLDQKLNLSNPKTYSEKLQWLKIYDRKSNYHLIADKYAVREYITTRIGNNFLTKLFGVYNDPNQINFDILPDKFVLKANHGCGWNIVCEDKKKLNIKQARRDLKNWLSQNYYYSGREWVYKDIKPLILCEEYLEGENPFGLLDYRFFCVNGNPEFIQVDIILNKALHLKERAFFDLNWIRTNFSLTVPEQTKLKIVPPTHFREMIEISKELSKGIPCLRVDFYDFNNRLINGELTFFTVAGFLKFIPYEYDFKFGEMLSLPND